MIRILSARQSTGYCAKRGKGFKKQNKTAAEFPLEIQLSGFPCGSAGKESACSVGDLGSISGLGSSPGEGKGCPLQYSGLENSMGLQRVDMTEQLKKKKEIQLSLLGKYFGANLELKGNSLHLKGMGKIDGQWLADLATH